MSLASLDKLLVIANPYAQSGAGEEAAREVETRLAQVAQAEGLDPQEVFAVKRTECRGQAEQLARDAVAQGFQTVMALGGDGVIHEAVNGLMAVERELRPVFAIIPIGSGNDYARTRGIARNKPLQALDQALNGTVQTYDIGCVNGLYFNETLSFGLDAAIALNSMESRKKDKAHGTKLYASNGIEVFTKQRRTYAYTCDLECPDGTHKTLEGEELIFAVQVGPTYGGGFKICPDASPQDGLLDICRTVKEPSLVYTLLVFFGARLGLHKNTGVVDFHKAKSLVIDFKDEPPCQTDGERLTGTHFEVSCVPQAVRIIG